MSKQVSTERNILIKDAVDFTNPTINTNFVNQSSNLLIANPIWIDLEWLEAV